MLLEKYLLGTQIEDVDAYPASRSDPQRKENQKR
jgi:hypothetical protein